MYRIHRAVHWASLDAYIRSLAPAAWFRQGVGITVTGSGVSQWDDQSGNGRHLLQGTDAARPIDLPFSGTRYLYLPGASGNYASTPDSVANSITGDIDIRVRVALDDWSPAANQTLVSKYAGGGAGNTSYLVRVLTTGAPQFYFASDGVTAITKTATANLSALSGGAVKWVRVTVDVDNGAGGYDVKFYTSDDGDSWSQLGATVTTATATSIFDSAVPVQIGVSTTGGAFEPLAGKIYRAIIKNGIDGTTVVDFNPADADGDGDTSFASSTTGETWTINSTGSLPAQIVGRSSVLFNGTSHYLKTSAFTLDQPTCVLMVVKQVSWTAADYIFRGESGFIGLTQSSVTPNLAIYAGSAVDSDPDLPVGDLGVVSCIFNGASSSIGINKNARATGNAGAGNAGGFALGSNAGGTANSHIQVYENVILPIAPSTAQLDRLVAGLMARHGVA